MEYTYIETLQRFVTVEITNPENLKGEDLESLAMPIVWEHIALNGWSDEKIFDSAIETKV